MPHGNWPHRTIFQLSIIGSALGSMIVNVHHFQLGDVLEVPGLTDEGRITQATALANKWLTSCKNNYLSAKTSDYTLNMVKCQPIEKPGNRNYRLSPVELAQTSANQGLGSGSVEELHSAGVIRWRTPRAGKQFRGRTYLGPIPREYMTDGRLNSVGNQFVGGYMTDLFDEFGLGGTSYNDWALTIYSRPFDEGTYGYPRGSHPNREIHYPEDYDGNATNVTGRSLDTVVRSQRRRQIGVGA